MKRLLLLSGCVFLIGCGTAINEINLKKIQGCNEIFLSPIFKVKKPKKFLGIIKFNLISNQFKNKIIALGGINQNNYKKLKTTNSIGFASISWAKKNGLRKLRPFLKLNNS